MIVWLPLTSISLYSFRAASKSDLACFDSYDLAFHISQFPIPVLTGIGHEQDDTITDLVAHTKLKTPTAVAGFLIDILADFEAALNEYSEMLVKGSQTIIHEKKLQLQLFQQRIGSGSRAFMADKTEDLLRVTGRGRHIIQKTIGDHRIRILRLGEQLKNSSRNLPDRKKVELLHAYGRLKQHVSLFLEHEKKRLVHHAKLKSYAEPEQILKLGFSVSRYKGKALKDIAGLKMGEIIETELNTGKIRSEITDLEKKLYIRKTKEETS
ncbi:MAG TPA: hypothetical protein ENI20_12185 [Bacteroides sp.]|nr:hypothetical protein [Bacteroides sp.]